MNNENKKLECVSKRVANQKGSNITKASVSTQKAHQRIHPLTNLSSA